MKGPAAAADWLLAANEVKQFKVGKLLRNDVRENANEKSNITLTRVEVWHGSSGHLNVVAAEEEEERVAGEANHVEEQDELQKRGIIM